MTNSSHILKSSITKRAIEEAKYIVKTGSTIRATARFFGVSKSTIHRDIKVVLEEADAILYQRVQQVIQTNKAERHLRGGEATRLKNELQAKNERTVKSDSKKKSSLGHKQETFHRKKAI